MTDFEVLVFVVLGFFLISDWIYSTVKRKGGEINTKRKNRIAKWPFGAIRINRAAYSLQFNTNISPLLLS